MVSGLPAEQPRTLLSRSATTRDRPRRPDGGEPSHWSTPDAVWYRRTVLPESSSLTSRSRFSRWSRATLALALSAGLLLQAGTSFAQSDEEKAAARALATQGAEALKNGKFAEATDLVSRAEAIVHAPTHLLMIARAHVGVGKLVAAQETYLKLLREDLAPSAPAAFKNAQAAAKDELAALEPKIASLRIIVDGAAQKKATVKLDDQPVPVALLNVFRPVDPGSHVVSVYAPGASPVKGSVDLREGEKKEIKLNVPDAAAGGVPVSATDNPDAGKAGPRADAGPPPPARDSGPGFFTPLRAAGVGVAAVGVVGIAVGAVFLSKGASTQSQADAKAVMLGCTDGGATCNTSLMSAVTAQVTPLDKTAAQDKTIGAAGVAVGAAALATGVVLIVIGKPAGGTSPRASVVPWFSGTAGGLRGEF